jgi:hypothetical protein
MAPTQRIQHRCGCVDEIHNGASFIELCQVHLAIANNPEYKQRLHTMIPPLMQQPQMFHPPPFNVTQFQARK